jgi:hypothetical protein
MMHFTLIALLQGSTPAQIGTDAMLDWFTGALVVVGLLQICVLIGQMRLIKSQNPRRSLYNFGILWFCGEEETWPRGSIAK